MTSMARQTVSSSPKMGGKGDDSRLVCIHQVFIRASKSESMNHKLGPKEDKTRHKQEDESLQETSKSNTSLQDNNTVVKNLARMKVSGKIIF